MTNLIGRRCTVTSEHASSLHGKPFVIVALTYVTGTGWLALIEGRKTGEIHQFVIGHLKLVKASHEES